MRLKNYILNEFADYKKVGRGKEITEDQALKLVPNFSQAIKSALAGNSLITRNRNGNEEFYFIDPKKGEPRRSANTLNYYTLIMDNSKRWSKYPKRSRSIIGLLEKTLYNQDYIVLPKNNAKIVLCSDTDLWYSFPIIRAGMNRWNIVVSYILSLPLYTDEEIDNHQNERRHSYDKNITQFKKACKEFDNWVDNTTMFSIDEIKNNINKKFLTTWIKWFDKWNGEPIFKYFEKTLDPKLNKFKLKNITNLSEENNEVWTDSESLMIKGHDNFKIFLERIKTKKLI